MKQPARVKKVKVCSLGFDCHATKLKHFVEWWHLPTKFILPPKVTKKRV